MTSPGEVHAALRTLELEVFRRLDGILHGDYEGLIPGHGTELGEAREYAPGDDVRRIDWNVTARTGTTHVRDTIADRELETTLVVDLSGSMAFGTARTTKGRLAVAVAGAFGHLVQRGGNRIGAVVLRGDRRWRWPHRSGRRHLQGLLARLLADEPGGRGDLGGALGDAARVARRRGFVVVVSDFLDDGDWPRRLRALARRHDVVAVEVVDPRERELVDVGAVVVRDPETGRRRWLDTSSPGLRARFREQAAARRAEIRSAIRAAAADHLVVATDRDWVRELVEHVALRRRGRTSGRRR